MSYAEQYGMIDERNIIDSEKFGARPTSKHTPWKHIARYCRDEYGIFVDWEKGFFICPECNEPIYECDWEDEELLACPVCEFCW